MLFMSVQNVLFIRTNFTIHDINSENPIIIVVIRIYIKVDLKLTLHSFQCDVVNN